MLSNMDKFSDDQAITSDAYSTTYIDVGKFAGQGEPIDILCRVTTTFNNLTSLHVSVTECDTVDGSYTDVDQGDTLEIPLANLVQGYTFRLRFLPNVTDRYIKLHYEVTGSNPTAGKIAAFLEAGQDYPYREGLYFDPRNPTGAASTANGNF